jgi:hypothetical protein
MPDGRLSKVKWFLIRRWSAPEKTIKASTAGHDEGASNDDLGTVSKLKRYLIRRWTSQIAVSQAGESSEHSLEDGGESGDGLGNFVAGRLVGATELLTIPATPATEEALVNNGLGANLERLTVPQDPRIKLDDQPSSLSSSAQRHRRSSSAGRNSGILVEEEDSQWLSQRGKEGNERVWRSSSPRDRTQAKSAESKSTSNEGGRGGITVETKIESKPAGPQQ